MDAHAIKTEKVKVLIVKLENSEKRVNDLLFEKEAMKSCIIDFYGLLSDIIETHDSMITITVKKLLSEKLKPVFTMLNRLEEPKIDNSEDEGPNENELKRRKEREAQINEHQRIVRKAEEKENAKREAQAMLESRKRFFLVWTLNRIMSKVVDMPSQ
ncbi:unnamed protein product [Lactuca saligna]|uniref:Uncharacterized protein n=1 Tax=Lactuca saligna TaxID=75948 RepID=A0AA36A4F2_LACSI|nr:unnamed protein product [Lactuca saligna]